MRTLFSGILEAGPHTLRMPSSVPSGVYFAGLCVEGDWVVRKFTVLSR
jgi:hypothetical protein